MRILIVEDEHKIANSIRQGLSQESYAVDVVYDGDKGYDFASTEDYDLVILDRMLPGMDGLAICQKLRAQQIHTPILMLTARGQLEEKVSGLDTGADDYMTKPFAFAELLARVRALARRPKVSTGSVLEVNDLRLDPIQFAVTRGKSVITLSNKEYALLHYLMQHKDKIITKEQIINHVWNYDADVLPNSVEVYIKHLRDKIDKPFPELPHLLHTVRGFGYRIGRE
jgi:DNA-binding response OmpR family regulator